jgi:hypothetical protein
MFEASTAACRRNSARMPLAAIVATVVALASFVRPAAAEDCAAHRARMWRAESEKTRLELDKQRMRRELESGEFCSICKNSKSEIEASTGKPFSQHLEKVKGAAVPAPPELILRKEAEYDAKIESKRREIEQARRSFDECETRERDRLRAERLSEERRVAAEQRARARTREQAQRDEEERKRADAEAAEQERREAAARAQRDAEAERRAAQRRQQEEEEERQQRANDHRAAMEAQSMGFEELMARSNQLPLEALVARREELGRQRSRALDALQRTEFQSDRWYELREECDMLKEQYSDLSGYITGRRNWEIERREARERQIAAEESAARAAEESRVLAERKAALALQAAAEQAGVRVRSDRRGVGAGSAMDPSPSPTGESGSGNALLSRFIEPETGSVPGGAVQGGSGRAGSAQASSDTQRSAGSALARAFDDPPPQTEVTPRRALTALFAGLIRERYNRERDARLLGPTAVGPAGAARARAGALDYLQENVFAGSIPESVRMQGDAWRMLFLPRAVGDTMGAVHGHVAFAERWVFSRIDAEMQAGTSQGGDASGGGASGGGGVSRPSGSGATVSGRSDPSTRPSGDGKAAADADRSNGEGTRTSGTGGASSGSSSGLAARPGTGISAPASGRGSGSASGGNSGVSRSGSALAPRADSARMTQTKAIARWASQATSTDEHMLATLCLLDATEESSWIDAPRSILYLHAAAALDLGDPDACRRALALLERRSAHLSPSEDERRILEALRRTQ